MLLNEIKIGCTVLNHAVNQTHHESSVRRGTNTNPVHITVRDVRHSRVDGNHTGPVCTSNIQSMERSHSSSHRTADKKQITQVGVIGLHFAGTVKAFSEDPLATADTTRIAGRSMANTIRRAQR